MASSWQRSSDKNYSITAYETFYFIILAVEVKVVSNNPFRKS